MPEPSSRIINPYVVVEPGASISAAYQPDVAVDPERIVVRLGRGGVILKMHPDTAVQLVGVLMSELKVRDEHLEYRRRQMESAQVESVQQDPASIQEGRS
ncbi:MAG TPA: hypothetical protein VGK94_07810 [Candidatus Polarisedimenticolia bacterium]|jgi:hypothetical protein